MKELNETILEIIKTFPLDGTHQYLWDKSVSYDGVTRNLYYKNTVIRENPDGSETGFCCGLTFQAWFEAMEKACPGFKTMFTEDEIRDILSIWFIQKMYGDGPGIALEKYGIGKTITDFNQIKAGDIVQFWRPKHKSGHSVIFIDWIYRAGKIIGVRYWSTQNWTNGIGYADEYFTNCGSVVSKELFFATRAFAEKRP